VIAVSAVRTGCGKSQVTRWLVKLLAESGIRGAVIRHPMPYGDLEAQRAQRFASLADLQSAHCTIEEREEYEPHIEHGAVVFAGVDYAEVVARAERECQLLLWDGGNNDYPFLIPDLHIVLLDALRPGHEHTHHPGEAVLRMADVALIAKSECADASHIAELEHSIRSSNPAAIIVHGHSPVTLEQAGSIQGKRVLVVEDGPTITHGGMAQGAGWRAAHDAGAIIVDPRPWAVGELAKAYHQYPHIGPVLPALGYFPQQLQDLRATLEASEVDAVVCGTPIDLARLLQLDKPVLRARYDYADPAHCGLREIVLAFLRERGLAR
jgi:predicted GTPase